MVKFTFEDCQRDALQDLGDAADWLRYIDAPATARQRELVQEVLDLMYIANTPAGPQSYALYFTAPKAQWNALHVDFDPEAQTFAPLPS